jgi:uncharacterized protein YbaP (TraB family)
MRLLLGLALLAAAANAAADPAAWEVSDGHGGRLWLLGSVHYLRAADYPLPEAIDRLYAGSDGLVLELDLDDLDPAQTQTTLIDAALLPEGTTLRDRLSEAAYAELARTSETLGIAVDSLEHFAPWFVALNLLNAGLAMGGFSGEYGLEQHLLASARADAKEVLGLETLDAQIDVLAGLSEREQQALLSQTIAEIGSASADAKTLVEAWRAGDVDTLRTALESETAGFPELYAALVARRNLRWSSKLEQLLNERQHYLVVVGALHLVGHDSVIELLGAHGFKVKRVEAKPRSGL